MTKNQVFYNFLSLAYPRLAKKFKKRGELYETFEDLKKEGHKFIYNTQTNKIVHIFLKSVYSGGEYSVKKYFETVKVEFTENGFKTLLLQG